MFNNTHVSAYINQGLSESRFDIGVAIGSNTAITALISSYSGSRIYGAISSSSYAISSDTFSPIGMTIVSSIFSEIMIYKNDKRVNSNSVSPSSSILANYPIYLLALNTAGLTSMFSTKRMSFASIGSGLTDQQAIQTSNVVTYSQGILNRK